MESLESEKPQKSYSMSSPIKSFKQWVSNNSTKTIIISLVLIIAVLLIFLISFIVYIRLTVNDSDFGSNELRENTISGNSVTLDDDSDLAPEGAEELNRFQFINKLEKPNSEFGIFFIFKKKSVACLSSSRKFNKAYNIAVRRRNQNNYNQVLPLYRVRVIDIEGSAIEQNVKANGVPYILFKIKSGVNKKIIGKRTTEQYYDLIVSAFNE